MFRFFGLMMLAVCVLCQSSAKADLFFEITPNGGGTDWTISGSGTTGVILSNALFPEFDLDGVFAPGTSETGGTGNFTLGPHTTDLVEAGIAFFSERFRFSWDTDIPAGTDLSGISGTVTLPIAISDINLPTPLTIDNSAVFGPATFQATAVPEPSSGLLIVSWAIFGLTKRRRK